MLQGAGAGPGGDDHRDLRPARAHPGGALAGAVAASCLSSPPCLPPLFVKRQLPGGARRSECAGCLRGRLGPCWAPGTSPPHHHRSLFIQSSCCVRPFEFVCRVLIRWSWQPWSTERRGWCGRGTPPAARSRCLAPAARSSAPGESILRRQ